MWAAWRQAGQGDPGSLLTRLEETVAEGMRSTGPRAMDTAWAAQHSGWPPAGGPAQGAIEAGPTGSSGQSSRVSSSLPGSQRSGSHAEAHAASQPARSGSGATGPGCWTCGKKGHRSYECAAGGTGKGRGKGGDEAIHSRMNKLERMLEQIAAKMGEPLPKK